METDETKRSTKTPENVESNNVIVNESVYEIWKPDRFNSTSTGLNEEDEKTRILCRSVMSLLNKLTPENYSTVSEKLKNLSIDTSVRMQQVVEIVHRKAVRDWKYCAIYAKVCDEMRDIQVTNELGIEKSFSLYLVGQCETYFVNNLRQDFKFDREKNRIIMCFDQKNKVLSLKDLQQSEYEFRKDSVGQCQFIGELFKVFLIHPQIIFLILNRLFKASGDVAVECIYAIISTIGAFYEEKIDKFPVEYFDKLRSSMSNDKLSQRTRFLIQDLLDWKKNCWHPRHVPELPKTIRQLDQETVLSESMSHLYFVWKKNKTKEIKFHSEWIDISIIYFEHLREPSGSKQEEKRNPIFNPTGKAHTFEDAVDNILDKLTAENLKPFTRAMKKLPINDGSRLQCIVDLIFEHAIDKPAMSKLYAEMCSNLQSLRVPHRKYISSESTVVFKTLLDNKCNREFDPDNTLEEVKSKSESHRKSVSKYRFFGELFNVEMLHVICLLRCIEKLLKSEDEESVKYLHVLLSVSEENLKSKLEQLHKKNDKERWLNKLKDSIENKKCYLPSEIKTVLEDLINMEKNDEFVISDRTSADAFTADKLVPIQVPIENHAPEQSSELPDKELVEEDTSAKTALEFEHEVARILNTLSYNDFTPFFELIKKFPICNRIQQQYLVNSIHQKAIDEPVFCKWYVQLCRKIQNIIPPGDKVLTFRMLLINKCQEQFERDKVKVLCTVKKQEEIDACTDPKIKKILQSSFNESEREFHRKQLGNCRLIAELSKEKFLTKKIMLRCINKLFESTDDLSLECICTILTIIGEEYEYKPNSEKNDSPPLKELDIRVEEMQVILDSKKCNVSPKIKCRFHDMANNWGSYKCFKNKLSQLKLENFDSNTKVIDNLRIKSVSRLRDIVDFIFNTAIDRTGFHKLYAKICRIMLYKTVLDKDRDEVLTFKMLLLDKCRQQSAREEVEKLDDVTEQKARQECLQKSFNYRRFLEKLCELFPDFEKNLKSNKGVQTVKQEFDQIKGTIEIEPLPKQKSLEPVPSSSESKKVIRVTCVQSEVSELLQVVFEQWNPNKQFPKQSLELYKFTSSSKKQSEAISELIKRLIKTDPSKAAKCGKFFVDMITHGYIQSNTIIAGLSCFLNSVENQLSISSSLDFIMTPLFESGCLKLDDLNMIFGKNSNTKPIENQESLLSNELSPSEQRKNNSSSPQQQVHVQVQKVSSLESFFDPFSTVKSPITSTTSSASNSIKSDSKSEKMPPQKIQPIVKIIHLILKKHTCGEFNRSEFKSDMENIPLQKAYELKILAQCIIRKVLNNPDLYVFYAKLCRPIALLTVEKKRYWTQLLHVCKRYFHRTYFEEDDTSKSGKKQADEIQISKHEITKKNMKGYCRFFASVINGLNNESANITCQRTMRKLIEIREIDVFCEIYEGLDMSSDRFEKSLFKFDIPELLCTQELEAGMRNKLQWIIEDFANREMTYQLKLQQKSYKKANKKGENIPKCTSTDTDEGEAKRRQSSSSGDLSEGTKPEQKDVAQIIQKKEISKKSNDSPAFLSNKQLIDAVNEVTTELLSNPDKIDELASRLCNLRIASESKLNQVVHSIGRIAMMNNAKTKLYVELCERLQNWKLDHVIKRNLASFRTRLICYLREYPASFRFQSEIKEYKNLTESDEKNFKDIPEKVINYYRLLCEFLKSPVFGSEFFVKDFILLLLLHPINEDAIELLNEFLNILRNDLHRQLINLEKQLKLSSGSKQQFSEKFEKYNIMFEIVTFLQEIINFQKRSCELIDIGSNTNDSPEIARNQSIVYNKRLNLYLKSNPSVIDKTITHFKDLCENPASFINSIVISMCRSFLDEWKKEETVRNIDKEFSSYALLFKIFSKHIPSFEFHCTNALFDFVKNSHFPPGMVSKMLEVLYLYEITPPESLIRFKNLFVSDIISDIANMLNSVEFKEYKLWQNLAG